MLFLISSMHAHEGKHEHEQVRRLAKARRHADVLASLAAARADSRTALEAAAYAANMTGTWLMEKENDWGSALKELSRAQCVPCFLMPMH